MCPPSRNALVDGNSLVHDVTGCETLQGLRVKVAEACIDRIHQILTYWISAVLMLLAVFEIFC
jgi:hypothetical protein